MTTKACLNMRMLNMPIINRLFTVSTPRLVEEIEAHA